MSLYYSDAGADRECPGLTLATKLKREYVYLTSFSKMRVDLAAQVHCVVNVCVCVRLCVCVREKVSILALLLT